MVLPTVALLLGLFTGVGQTGGTGHFLTGVLDVTPPEFAVLPGVATTVAGQGLTQTVLLGVVELAKVGQGLTHITLTGLASFTTGGHGVGQIDAILGVTLFEPELLPTIGFPIGTHFGVGHPVTPPLELPPLPAIIGQTTGTQLLLGTGLAVGVTLGKPLGRPLGSGLGDRVGLTVGVGQALGLTPLAGLPPGVGSECSDSRGAGLGVGLTPTGGSGR